MAKRTRSSLGASKMTSVSVFLFEVIKSGQWTNVLKHVEALA